MSRRNPDGKELVISRVDHLSEFVREASDKLVSEYCKPLDAILENIQKELSTDKTITDSTLEYHILDLASVLYFTGSAQEDLGIKEDTCKAIRQEVYNKTREAAKGTVADKDMQATLATQNESIVLAIYSRAYKKVKLRMEAGYEMLNSLKKVMNKRVAEAELSNSRYIGTQRRE